MSSRQAIELNERDAHIRKGEKGSLVVYADSIKRKETEKRRATKSTFLRALEVSDLEARLLALKTEHVMMITNLKRKVEELERREVAPRPGPLTQFDEDALAIYNSTSYLDATVAPSYHDIETTAAQCPLWANHYCIPMYTSNDTSGERRI